jgi:hypothetical protein
LKIPVWEHFDPAPVSKEVNAGKTYRSGVETLQIWVLAAEVPGEFGPGRETCARPHMPSVVYLR